MASPNAYRPLPRVAGLPMRRLISSAPAPPGERARGFRRSRPSRMRRFRCRISAGDVNAIVREDRSAYRFAGWQNTYDFVMSLASSTVTLATGLTLSYAAKGDDSA